MTTLEDVLLPQNVMLHFEAENVEEAVEKAVQILKSDFRILDWPTFADAVAEREKQNTTNIGGGLLLPHARGAFVQELVMSLVSLQKPLALENGEVRCVIAVAIPSSMASDYLRIVGSLARVFRDEKAGGRLNSFKTASELLTWLLEKSR